MLTHCSATVQFIPTSIVYKLLSYHDRKNLSVRSRSWWAKAILINLILFLVLFFLTTPAVIMTFLEDFAPLTDTLDSVSSFNATTARLLFHTT